ncbi:MAG: hypothetical protein AAGB31_02395 [Bdellovibrio sp.]
MANRRGSSGVESGGKNSEKVVEIALEGGGSGGFFRTNSGSRRSVGVTRKVSSVPLSAFSEDEQKKLQKKNESGGSVVITGENFAPAPKKIPVKKPEVKVLPEEDKPITIGNFIRYLFIAALIIALVIFIGGQALQMSKSFEK